MSELSRNAPGERRRRAPLDTSEAPGERRRNDRRAGDRRRRSEPLTPWPADDDVPPDAWPSADDRADWQSDDAPTEPHLGGGAQARVFRTYLAARAAVGIGLVGAQVALAWLGPRGGATVVLVCIAYAVQALTLWLLPRYQPLFQLPASSQSGALRQRQWLSTIGVDLLAFSALHLMQLSSSFNFAALLVLPVLMAGVTTHRLAALATAAAVTLMLLVSGWQGALAGGDSTIVLMQSGLAGLGLFVISLLAGELAGRLAREELAARGSREIARQQALLNRMVIEEMADGVLVVDAALQVRAANPAARALLVAHGLSPPAPFGLQDQEAWRGLAEAVTLGLQSQAPLEWPDAGRDVMLPFDDGQVRALRLRGRFIRTMPTDSAGQQTTMALAVLLLEDVRTVQARIRQEKLAAMGRVSVGIAHEIRNPLAAIAQANALLEEDLEGVTQQRLLRIVSDNVARLKRLVDDVMEVAPGMQPTRRVIDASREVAAASADWAGTVGLPLGGASRLRAVLPGTPLGVVFDAEHLRRVLVNLLDNAHRHSSQRPGAIELLLSARDEFSVQIAVRSDSAPIAADIERFLFEPFFSTRSRGSGLGLYICRELCERYGASIEYRSRGAADALPNEFVVTLRRAPLSEAELALPLEP